jgi:hypothetical protein
VALGDETAGTKVRALEDAVKGTWALPPRAWLDGGEEAYRRDAKHLPLHAHTKRRKSTESTYLHSALRPQTDERLRGSALQCMPARQLKLSVISIYTSDRTTREPCRTRHLEGETRGTSMPRVSLQSLLFLSPTVVSQNTYLTHPASSLSHPTVSYERELHRCDGSLSPWDGSVSFPSSFHFQYDVSVLERSMRLAGTRACGAFESGSRQEQACAQTSVPIARHEYRHGQSGACFVQKWTWRDSTTTLLDVAIVHPMHRVLVTWDVMPSG